MGASGTCAAKERLRAGTAFDSTAGMIIYCGKPAYGDKEKYLHKDTKTQRKLRVLVLSVLVPLWLVALPDACLV
jgi:hypothetical protein